MKSWARMKWRQHAAAPVRPPIQQHHPPRNGKRDSSRYGKWIMDILELYSLPLQQIFLSLSLFLLSQVDAACTSSSWLLFSFLISKLPVCWPSRRKGSSSMWKMWRCLLLLLDQLLLLQEIYRFLFISWFYSSIELGTGWTRREINPEWKR